MAGFHAARNRSFAVRERLRALRPNVLRAAGFTLAASLLLAAPVLAAKLYQTAHLRTLFTTYAQADWEPLPVQAAEASGMSGWTLNKPETWVDYAHLPEAQRSWQTHATYLMLEFDTQGQETWFVPKYHSTTLFNDFSKQRRISPPPGKTGTVRYFLPVFESPNQAVWGNRTFEGILTRDGDPTRLKGIYRLSDLSEAPLLLDLTLRDGWENEALSLHFKRNRLPLCLRAKFAYRGNLLQGGFKEWLSGKAPVLASPPKKNSLLRFYEATGALEQIWKQPDSLADAAALFSVSVPNLKPMTRYEFFVRAFNPAGAPV